MCCVLCDLFIFSVLVSVIWFFFFFNDTATTEIYTLSLHDALPIYGADGDVRAALRGGGRLLFAPVILQRSLYGAGQVDRSEEHTSELQSQSNLVCRLLLEKKQLACLGAWFPVQFSSLLPA